MDEPLPLTAEEERSVRDWAEGRLGAHVCLPDVLVRRLLATIDVERAETARLHSLVDSHESVLRALSAGPSDAAGIALGGLRALPLTAEEETYWQAGYRATPRERRLFATLDAARADVAAAEARGEARGLERAEKAIVQCAPQWHPPSLISAVREALQNNDRGPSPSSRASVKKALELLDQRLTPAVASPVLHGLRGECRAVTAQPLVREMCASCGHSKALHPTDGGCWSGDGRTKCKCISFYPVMTAENVSKDEQK